MSPQTTRHGDCIQYYSLKWASKVHFATLIPWFVAAELLCIIKLSSNALPLATQNSINQKLTNGFNFHFESQLHISAAALHTFKVIVASCEPQWYEIWPFPETGLHCMQFNSSSRTDLHFIWFISFQFSPTPRNHKRVRKVCSSSNVTTSDASLGNPVELIMTWVGINSTYGVRAYSYSYRLNKKTGCWSD
jgi:hypothetical protein